MTDADDTPWLDWSESIRAALLGYLVPMPTDCDVVEIREPSARYSEIVNPRMVTSDRTRRVLLWRPVP